MGLHVVPMHMPDEEIRKSTTNESNINSLESDPKLGCFELYYKLGYTPLSVNPSLVLNYKGIAPKPNPDNDLRGWR